MRRPTKEAKSQQALPAKIGMLFIFRVMIQKRNNHDYQELPNFLREVRPEPT